MNILIFPNFEKTNSIACTRLCVAKLLELGAVPMLDAGVKQHTGEMPSCLYGEFEELLPRCDVLLTVGGDGTILKAVQSAVRADKPLLGVNTGRIGFLSQLEMDELDKLALLAQGKYRLSHRMLLEAELVLQEGGGRHLALNEVNVIQGDNGKLVEISATQGGRSIVLQRASGLIAATPTGSTAYSLAAGGSIADPETELLLLTCICPYSVFNRSLVLPAEKEYLVREENAHSHGGLAVYADGNLLGHMRGGEYILVRRAPVQAKLVDFGLRDFYTNLREKLSLRG